MDTKLEVVVLPVTDVDRAKHFYASLGWRLDADFSADGLRVIQVNPPGSGCSIVFGSGINNSAPGSTQGLLLTVTDIESACAELAGRGVEIGEIFHDATGVFHHSGQAQRSPGLDPQRRSYASFAAFFDPDGNGWLLQEVITRRPGR